MITDKGEIQMARVTKRLTGLKCPRCGKTAEGGTNLNDSESVTMPKPGDFAICLYCGSINCYTDTLGLRRIERTEQRRMQRDPRLSKLMEAALDLSRRYRRGVQ